MKFRLLSIITVAPVLLGASNVSFGEEDVLYSALKAGTLKLNMRLRYEDVDVDKVVADHSDEARGLTVRTRLGYQTGKLSGFDAYGEFEDTHVVLTVDDYAARTAGYGVIADPTFTELNQAWLRYTGSESFSGLTGTFGRQRIIYDNARFVGNVGWRQNEQTYDASRVDYAFSDFSLSASHLKKVNSFIGTESFIDAVLLNASWKGAPGGMLAAYSYMIDPKDIDSSLDTTGIRYVGKFSLDKVNFLVSAEYASQSYEPESGTNKDASYMFAEAGVIVAGVTVKLAQEVLGSDDGTYGFDTPLATKHAFNGWADTFLATPVSGLEDTFVTVAGSAAGIGLKVVYHEFSQDEVASGSTNDFGSELDLQAVKKFGPYTVGLKYAQFDAEKNVGKFDTNKLWAWTEMAF